MRGIDDVDRHVGLGFARRLLQALAVMAVVSLISFSLFNYVGDPVDNMVGQEATLEDRARIREVLGLGRRPRGRL